MRIAFALLLTLALAACGGESPEDVAAREATVKEAALAAMKIEPGYSDDIGIFVSGYNIVLNYPTRNDQYGNVARAAALAAAKAIAGKEFTVHAIDGAEVATSVPEDALCKVSAGDGRIKGNTC